MHSHCSGKHIPSFDVIGHFLRQHSCPAWESKFRCCDDCRKHYDTGRMHSHCSGKHIISFAVIGHFLKQHSCLAWKSKVRFCDDCRKGMFFRCGCKNIKITLEVSHNSGRCILAHQFTSSGRTWLFDTSAVILLNIMMSKIICFSCEYCEFKILIRMLGGKHNFVDAYVCRAWSVGMLEGQ